MSESEEKAIEIFKSFVELGNTTNADNINITIDLANIIIKYIKTLEENINEMCYGD